MVAMTFKTSVSLSLKQQNLKLFFSVLMAKFKIQEKHFSKVTNLAKINRKNWKLEPDVISRTQKSQLANFMDHHTQHNNIQHNNKSTTLSKCDARYRLW